MDFLDTAGTAFPAIRILSEGSAAIFAGVFIIVFILIGTIKNNIVESMNLKNPDAFRGRGQLSSEFFSGWEPENFFSKISRCLDVGIRSGR